MAADAEITVVTMVFDAADRDGDLDGLLGVLARYVVLARTHDGCRNVDLCASVTTPGRVVVIQKWASPQAQQAHFDSPEMVAMAEGCVGRLARPPQIDLLEGISAHDLA